MPIERTLRIVHAEPRHFRALSENLRPGDAGEFAPLGIDARAGLWRCYRKSLARRTILLGDDVAAMAGVAGTALGDEGGVWLFTTPLVEQQPVAFLKCCRELAGNALSIFRKISGIVSLDYVAAVRFLGLMGFTVGEPLPIPTGRYARFWMER